MTSQLNIVGYDCSTGNECKCVVQPSRACSCSQPQPDRVICAPIFGQIGDRSPCQIALCTAVRPSRTLTFGECLRTLHTFAILSAGRHLGDGPKLDPVFSVSLSVACTRRPTNRHCRFFLPFLFFFYLFSFSAFFFFFVFLFFAFLFVTPRLSIPPPTVCVCACVRVCVCYHLLVAREILFDLV